MTKSKYNTKTNTDQTEIKLTSGNNAWNAAIDLKKSSENEVSSKTLRIEACENAIKKMEEAKELYLQAGKMEYVAMCADELLKFTYALFFIQQKTPKDNEDIQKQNETGVKLLSLYEQLHKKKKKDIYLEMADIYWMLGENYLQLKDKDLATNNFKNAQSLYKKADEKKSANACQIKMNSIYATNFESEDEDNEIDEIGSQSPSLQSESENEKQVEDVQTEPKQKITNDKISLSLRAILGNSADDISSISTSPNSLSEFSGTLQLLNKSYYESITPKVSSGSNKRPYGFFELNSPLNELQSPTKKIK